MSGKQLRKNNKRQPFTSSLAFVFFGVLIQYLHFLYWSLYYYIILKETVFSEKRFHSNSIQGDT
ncbi:hypothetical protein LEP1GSC193_3720 [Leptospira alstonii serovar Pingchang str. 80-412]|uniref:Uncharacterized protein n=2 Tax=Leptospira alstonii TaxID=28452 RepID=M6D8Y3_9LEPT|nr:hypothetical protein LEP1GSC194_1985 [Leptospira alstonii serovar Sichuan str. 79601]EQA79670.1 hypothetical protein LEP1GSC193_3720 [Leptospira alstonii serovar Pingchang str. 80-412]